MPRRNDVAWLTQQVASTLFWSVLLFSSLCHGGMLDEYFYIQEINSKNNNGNVHHHVQEYLATSGTKPNFLYDSNYPNGRIVEFYAHWCPHCQHFKPKYMEFSINIHEITEKMNLKVETFAVSCVPNRAICKDQNIHTYPFTRFFPPHSINGTDISPFSLHPHDVMRKLSLSGTIQDDPNLHDTIIDTTKLEIRTGRSDNNPHLRSLPQPVQTTKTTTTTIESSTTKKSHYFFPRSKMEVFHDAHLSFQFAMKTAVYTSVGPLSKDKQDVLKPFLRILQKTLPVTMTVQPLLNDMLSNFEILAQGDDQLNIILERHPSPYQTWSESSTQHGTGYTAGLWTLFHIMSVGLVEWNQMVLDDSQVLIPSEVADTLRSYIEYFFQCDVCRLNFMNEYDACSYDRCNRLISKRRGTLEQYMQFPLWLFETHNAVNTRLRTERIELHDEPKGLTTPADVMWPPTELCSSCWVSEGHWDEYATFQFLHATYWPETDTEVTRSLQEGNSNGNNILHHAGRPMDETAEQGIKMPEVVFGGAVLSGVMLIVWQRKRQFDRKGMLKRRESF